ncbi:MULTISPECIES: hypothetical protein [Flammeovirga]|uniref:Outer membrane protein beta-barrel domain-containing protein n=1 Tax=Flammeovirga agarivorans TaxID=2726742 RepID=A0A7X8SGS0_9BACT|nr:MULTISPECIES: hypothetical protein [Flammeovirga]NLR89894.1 hypothetical protein [Flammeovirga agarivorans]
MKKLFNLILTLALLSLTTAAFAQNGGGSADYKGPGTLNVGLTSGFGNYLGVGADYEFNLAQDFTVGPSVEFNSWNNYEGKDYTAFAIGARFRWYADRVLKITHPKWDVFANGNIGFNINGPDGLWWGLGIGGKFHISDSFGLQAIIGSGAQIGVTFQL